MKKLLYLSLVGFFALTACKDTDGAVSVTPGTIEASFEAADYTVDVLCDGMWETVVDPDATWISLVGAWGNGNGTIVVHVDQSDRIEPRETAIQVKSGGTTKKITIRQACAVAPANAQTDRLWRIGEGDDVQIWSDAINIPECNKTDYDEGGEFTPIPDCRNNPGYAYLYSWAYAAEKGDVLCPDGWRVPTKDDFLALDLALGGNGRNDQADIALRNRYVEEWGAQYGGYYVPDAGLMYQGEMSFYWAQSEHTALFGNCWLMYKAGGAILPQLHYEKKTPFMVRCVR